MFVLDPNRRPLAAGVYESSLRAADGATVVYTLVVTIRNRQAMYEIHRADGTLADALQRHRLRTDGTTGWWSVIGQDRCWGTRADAAYAAWMTYVQQRLADDGFPADPLPPPADDQILI